jgi:glycerophosphoryl diester phosphodiesterase
VRAPALAVCLFLSACAGDESETAPPPPALILDPALFDCTATTTPQRVSTTPIACGLDPTCRTPQVAGHRGAGGQLGKIAPEDTLAAYRAAIVLGVDYVETDPRPTADGVIVNMHDADVDRTTDGTGAVDELDFDQIRALHIDAAQFPGDYTCEKVPTLEEILTLCKDRVIVLVDANKTDRVDLLVAAIQSTDTLEWAIFDTSSPDKIDEALALEPGLYTHIRVTSTADLEMQLDHFAAHPPVIVELQAEASLAEVGAAVHANQNRVLRDVFAYDLVADLDGDVSHYAEPFDGGADIVQTDRPDLVLELLGRR